MATFNYFQAVWTIKSENFERESFDIVETYIVLLESRLDEMVADNEIPKKLWALINSSIYNFNVYLSYLMVNSIKIKKYFKGL